MTHTKPDHSKKYTAADFKPYVKTHADWDQRGLLPLPHFEAIEWQALVNAIGYAPHPTLHGYIPYPDGSGQNWGMLWMNTLQGGGWSGSGYVTIPRSTYRDGKPEGPIMGRFALCNHKNVLLASANPRRGLHDQFCELCGLDTSVDSSD